MNFLKEELERKKKDLTTGTTAVQASGGGTKFFRRGDLIRAEEEKKRLEQERIDREKREAKRLKEQEEARTAENILQLRLAKQAAAARMPKASGGGDKADGGPGQKEGGDAGQHGSLGDGQLPPEEVKERLRSLGAPITLFGETDAARLLRLRNAENEDPGHDFGLGGGFETRNQALEKRKRDDGQTEHDFDDHNDEVNEAKKGEGEHDDDESSMGESESEGEKDGDEDGGGGKKRKKDGGGVGHEMAAGEAKEPKAAPKPMSEHRRIYKTFRGLLREWEQDLNARPDHIKRTVQGRLETKTQKQCKDYIRPLFKLCKARSLPDGIRANLIRMINFCEEGEFVKAQEEYLRTAIGNAPWPIGLTMVGIHERTGREKISSNKVAHIMNNEMQRKYLTSVKRLMRFAQDKRPDVAPSKKVL